MLVVHNDHFPHFSVFGLVAPSSDRHAPFAAATLFLRLHALFGASSVDHSLDNT